MTGGDVTDEHIQSDLAFVKALVSEGARVRVSGGALYLTGGVCYGVQCLAQWIHLAGIVDIGGLGNLIAGILPTVVFLAVMCVILWRDRHVPKNGVATRALNAAFSSAGLANLFMVGIFAWNAITEKSILIWLLYPITVCAFQGAVWFTAYMIRREVWLAVISVSWFITTLVLGFLSSTSHYVLVLGLALFVIMGGGGWYMMQQAKKAA